MCLIVSKRLVSQDLSSSRIQGPFFYCDITEYLPQKEHIGLADLGKSQIPLLRWCVVVYGNDIKLLRCFSRCCLAPRRQIHTNRQAQYMARCTSRWHRHSGPSSHCNWMKTMRKVQQNLGIVTTEGTDQKTESARIALTSSKFKLSEWKNFVTGCQLILKLTRHITTTWQHFKLLTGVAPAALATALTAANILVEAMIEDFLRAMNVALQPSECLLLWWQHVHLLLWNMPGW